uniref:Uncharacterized protein n=1 Tax=Cyanothece sp. (strain PCC 7425 / ATCC 29141) TaxID=395961 RepID=B8HRI3_CYAP4
MFEQDLLIETQSVSEPSTIPQPIRNGERASQEPLQVLRFQRQFKREPLQDLIAAVDLEMDDRTFLQTRSVLVDQNSPLWSF